MSRAGPAGPSPHPPQAAVVAAVERALAEDLLPLGDLSATLVDPWRTATLAVVAREEGVLAGRRCAEETFARAAPGLRIEWRLDDGDALGPGTEVALVRGALAPALSAERTALNFLCHLSGVATLTRRFVDTVSAVDPTVAVLDTHKTIPGLRALEKAAVRAGGGRNHRGSLSDAVLLKDNHLGGLTIAEAVARARRAWPGRLIEVECDRPEQVAEACRAGASMVMLDNMSPEEVEACVTLARATASGPVVVEASGGVTLETAPRLAAAGVDAVSVGALTHSAPALDLGMDLRSVGGS